MRRGTRKDLTPFTPLPLTPLPPSKEGVEKEGVENGTREDLAGALTALPLTPFNSPSEEGVVNGKEGVVGECGVCFFERREGFGT